MSYELGFVAAALKEWRKLDANIRHQFKKKLAERCINPRVPHDKLSGAKDRYKIKLRGVGYRLVYEVRDEEIIILVVAVGITCLKAYRVDCTSLFMPIVYVLGHRHLNPCLWISIHLSDKNKIYGDCYEQSLLHLHPCHYPSTGPLYR